MARVCVDDWAADAHAPTTELDLTGAAIEFMSTPTDEQRPAPFYAELVQDADGERRVYRTFFHSVDQLGLHPSSSSRLEGLLRGKVNLLIDASCPLPRVNTLRARVTEYPANGETHHCLVLDEAFRAAPLDTADQFASHRKIRSFAS